MKNNEDKQISIKKLLVVIGIFLLAGVLLFFLFRRSVSETMEAMNREWIEHASIETPFWKQFLFQAVTHLKYYFIFSLFMLTIIRIPFGYVFFCFKGVQSGFLFGFFIYEYGMKGIWMSFSYWFPHGLLLIPVYLLLIRDEKQEMSGRCRIVLTIMVLLATFLEVRFNIGIMEQLRCG